MMRGNARSIAEASYNGVVRRMVSLPRNIFRDFSRVMGQGMDLIGIGSSRRSNHHFPSSNLPFQQHPTSDFPQHHYPLMNNYTPQHNSLQPSMVLQEELAFLASFEQQYGTTHPFFYACRFMDALKMAQDEHKFIFVYLHSLDQHSFTASFCRETLCSELVVQFLDANFVCWGALANRGEGFHLASTLRASSFPFCALVAPASDDNMAVLQQVEGPVSPAELVEILQRTLEEQGLAFGSGKAKEEERRRADRRLREEQDAAYIAALQIDQEKEKLENLTSEQRISIPKGKGVCNLSNQEKIKQGSQKQQGSRVNEATRIDNASGKGNGQVTQILIRFPNGERKEQSFMSTDKMRAIFRFIDSLALPGIGNYRLVSNFPRKVYGVDQMGMTLKDAGLHPKASLFLELL